MTDHVPGGSLRLADDLVISRMGFGAMQLAGPGVFGPPRDRGQALAVLREAVGMGITHIDLVLPAEAIAELDRLG